MEIDQLLHIGMEIGLLLNGVIDLHEERFVDQLLDAAYGEMRHKILTVTKITQIIESVEQVSFKVKQSFGLVVHSQPKHPWRVVAAKESRSVEVHGERLMLFGHFLTSLDDGWNILFGCIAHKLQSQMYLIGFHIIDILLMLKVLLQLLNERREFRATRNGNGKEGSFGFH